MTASLVSGYREDVLPYLAAEEMEPLRQRLLPRLRPELLADASEPAPQRGLLSGRYAGGPPAPAPAGRELGGRRLSRRILERPLPAPPGDRLRPGERAGGRVPVPAPQAGAAPAGARAGLDRPYRLQCPGRGHGRRPRRRAPGGGRHPRRGAGPGGGPGGGPADAGGDALLACPGGGPGVARPPPGAGHRRAAARRRRARPAGRGRRLVPADTWSGGGTGPSDQGHPGRAGRGGVAHPRGCRPAAGGAARGGRGQPAARRRRHPGLARRRPARLPAGRRSPGCGGSTSRRWWWGNTGSTRPRRTPSSRPSRPAAWSNPSPSSRRSRSTLRGFPRGVRLAAVRALAGRRGPSRDKWAMQRPGAPRGRRRRPQAGAADPRLAGREPAPAGRRRAGVPARHRHRHRPDAAQRHRPEGQVQGAEGQGAASAWRQIAKDRGLTRRAARGPHRARLRAGRARPARVRLRPATVPLRPRPGHEAAGARRGRQGQARTSPKPGARRTTRSWPRPPWPSGSC